MAGKRSPWGKPAGNSNNGGEGGGSGDGGGGGDDTPSGSDDAPRGPRNPWLPGGGGEGSDRGRRSANIEDLFKNRGPEGPRRGGGPGGPKFRIPQRPGGKSWLPIAIVAIIAIWIFASSFHFVQPRQQGIVTWMGGKYSETLSPGTNVTLPWPINTVDIENVSEIRSVQVGSGSEKLILTGDQNLVDLSYLIRWNIKDLTQFRFQLADPVETMQEVAEAAMRSSVAEEDLDTVLSGAGRGDIELRVRNRMQAILDAYGSGIAVQGIEIDRTDPPEQVIEAFNDVLASQQNAEQEINQARRYAQQLLAQAEGGSAAFNKIYAEYRLAPEVTRRRLYYETMESVLAKTDKTIIETDGVTTYLPLPEIQQRSQSARQNAQAQPPELTVAPQQGGQ